MILNVAPFEAVLKKTNLESAVATPISVLYRLIALVRQSWKCQTDRLHSTAHPIGSLSGNNVPKEPWPPSLHGASSGWPEALHTGPGSNWPRLFV